MIVLRWLWAQVQAEPVYAQGLVQASIACATVFGVHWSGAQVGMACGLSAAFLTFLTRKLVTPTTTADAQIRAALYTPVPALPPQ